MFSILFFSGKCSSDSQVTTIKKPTGRISDFCPHAAAGDLYIKDGKFHFIFGSGDRTLQRHINDYYPRFKALGLLLGFAPDDTACQSSLVTGTPIVRISERTEYVSYMEMAHQSRDCQTGLLFRIRSPTVEVCQRHGQ